MKPNILFINSITIYGGGEVWMLTLIRELVKRGYKVTLVCKKEAEIIKYVDKESIVVLPIRIAGDFDPFTIFKIASIYRKRKIDITIAKAICIMQKINIQIWLGILLLISVIHPVFL